MSFRKDLGAVSSYALAVEAGYEGTEEEFAAEQAEFAKNAKLVAEAKTAAESAKKGAEDAKTDAETAADKAATAAIRQPVINSGTWWLWDFEKGEYVDSGVSVRPEDAVLFVPQEKSEDEKAQARENIGALAESEVKDSELIESAENATVLVLEGENIKRVAGDKLGGAKSWNDLTDKPFGEETEYEVIDEITTEAGREATSSAKEELALESDKTYVVTFDGVDYECNNHLSGNGAVVLGNPSFVISADDNGIPFCVYYIDMVKKPYVYVKDTSVAHTVAIKIPYDVITPIEGKYLPKGTPWIEEGEMVEVLAETTVTFTETGEGFAGDAISLVVGESYTVNWNGVEYVCVAQDASAIREGAVCIGDCTVMGLDGNNEPFIIAVLLGRGAIVTALDGSAEAVVSIYQSSEIAHPIDPRCLPDGIGGEYDVIFEVSDDGETATLVKGSFEVWYNAYLNKKLVNVAIYKGSTVSTVIRSEQSGSSAGLYMRGVYYNGTEMAKISLYDDGSVRLA